MTQRPSNPSTEAHPSASAELRGPLVQIHQNTDWMSKSTTGLLVLAILYTLHLGQSIVLPLAAALLTNFVLRPVVRKLANLRVPPPLTALLVVLLLAGTLTTAVVALKAPAARWLEQAPTALKDVGYRIRELKQPIASVKAATKEIEQLGQVAATDGQKIVLRDASLNDQLLLEAQQALTGLGSMLVMLFFVLAWGDRLYRNVVNALPHFADQRKLVGIVQEMEHTITHYLATITVINVGLGIVVTAAMYLVGMPNAILWGAIAGVLNYIPYLGPALTFTVIAFASLLSFDSIAQAAVAPMVFMVITMFEGYVITPMAVGSRLTLNPMLIFFTLVLCYTMWGVIGAIITVPLMVCVKVALQRSKSGMVWSGIMS